MYIIIYEDGEIGTLSKITEKETDAYEAGILDIIHVEDENPVIYSSTGWEVLI